VRYKKIIIKLTKNKDVFKELLTGLSEEEYLWKPFPDKWCLLEITCHLFDEEREDFRTRIKHVLETPKLHLVQFDQLAWVQDRKYIEQNYKTIVSKFINERERSIKWLESLNNSNWDNYIDHPKFGQMSAKMFLSNWLAHDYLHLRQILKLKFDYLKHISSETLVYAGNW